VKISYLGITTNNVKDVDVRIETGQIVFFGGPSGSGKSSIAVDTIHKISEDELSQLFSTREDVSRYAIKDYENILPSVCLQQENYNRNPRSTIATYFGLDIYFKQLFSSKNSVSQSRFQFNTLISACEVCKGTGSCFAPDPLSIVDYSCTIGDIPFRTWRASRREYYQKALALFSNENAVDPTSRFNEISHQNQEILLYGESREKYKIEFKSNGRKHTKTAKYIGPILELTQDIEKGRLPKHRAKYLAEVVCRKCEGARFSIDSLKFQLYGKSIGELYLLEIDALLNWIRQKEPEWQRFPDEARPFRRIASFLESLIRLNLNYLNLNRSIPTLSGGELQRLRLAKAVNSHFANFIYVLDEPTSGLHPCEWQTIADVIRELKKKKNTIILIEHNEFLKNTADRVIMLGPSGGSGGGHIVTGRHKAAAETHIDRIFFKSNATIEIRNASSNNIDDLSCSLPLGTLVGICGVSGSGKSSLMKTILPRYLNNTQYISQVPIRGNSYSIVATAIGVLDDIQKLFSIETRCSREYFSFSSKGKGQCEVCCGKGIVEDDSSYIREPLLCPACSGCRFSANALKCHWGNLNIYDFLRLSIDDVISQVPDKYVGLRKSLSLAAEVGLGYLTLFQNTSTLSGGEAQRIKFVAKMLESNNKQIYLLDEPFRGVDRENIRRIVHVLYSLVRGGSTVFIAEHSPFALGYCSYILELGPGSGAYGGKIVYLGERDRLHTAEASRMAPFIEC
jgi:excinuclease ABC subunit A